MIIYKASETDKITVNNGVSFRLESLRQAVVPPYVMIVPFLDCPSLLEILEQESLDEEGVHGCIYTLRAVLKGSGTLTIGFKETKSGNKLIEKAIDIRVSRSGRGQ